MLDFYKHGLSSIFWGLLIVFLNFDINGVSILPNFIGFLLVLSGLREVAKQDEGVKSIIPWTNGLIIISAISWFSSFIRTASLPAMKQQVGFIMIDLPVIDLFFITDGIEMLLTLIFVALLMNYYIHIVPKSGEAGWATVFKRRRDFYVIVNGLMLVGMPFFIMFPLWLVALFAILLLLGLIAFIRILLTAYRMKKLFENNGRVETEEVEKSEPLAKPFFLKRKKASITALMFIIVTWTGSMFWVEQWRLEEPLLLPAFIATTGDSHVNTYYLHNGRAEQTDHFMNFFDHFHQNTVYTESYFSIDHLYFPPEDLDNLKALTNSGLTLYDGTHLKNNGELHYLELTELKTDPFQYLKLQSGSGGSDGYMLTFEVQKSFEMVDDFALPFSEKLLDYFTFNWENDGIPIENDNIKSRNREFVEGDVLTFSITPIDHDSYKRLATFQASIRIVVDGGEGEEMIDVGWVEQYPSYDLSAIQEFVRKFK